MTKDRITSCANAHFREIDSCVSEMQAGVDERPDGPRSGREKQLSARARQEVVMLLEALDGFAKAHGFMPDETDETRECRQGLSALYARIEAIYDNDGLDWENKYDLIFHSAPRVRALMTDLGLRPLDYYDPDMGYQDDVSAYVRALREQLKPVLDALAAG